jgi:hypothetical protein
VVDVICPAITLCREKVTIDQYSNICANMSKDAYKDCPAYARLIKETRTPSEWARSMVTAPP